MRAYLTAMRLQGIVPNFWSSAAYLERAGARELTQGHLVWLEASGVPLFPPLSHSGDAVPPHTWPKPYCWSDFSNLPAPEGEKRSELDLEYIYLPSNFLRMEGGHWSVFRKNSRKFPRDNPGFVYTNEVSLEWETLEKLFRDWMAKFNEDAIIHDAQVMLLYLADIAEQGTTVNFGWKALVSSNGELVGINVWDRNWHYTNFRYCICSSRYRFLSEYLRLLFYTDSTVAKIGLPVCDGGILDRKELMHFKDKMNPASVRVVYSWGDEPEDSDGD